MSDIEKGLSLKNIVDTVRREMIGILNVKKRCDKDFKNYKRSLHEITNNITGNSKNKYIRNDIAEKIIKNCRGVKKCKSNTRRKDEEKQRQNFRCVLDFKENDLFFTKEQSVLNKTLEAFSKYEISLKHSVLEYKIDAYFVKYKLAVEIDENRHADRDSEKEKIRESKIRQKLGCTFISINPDSEKYSIFTEISHIFDHISKFVKEKIEELDCELNKLKINNTKSLDH